MGLFCAGISTPASRPDGFTLVEALLVRWRAGRSGSSLVEMLLAIVLGGLITGAAVSAIAPTNELARTATEATQHADGARSTVHLLAAELRRLPAGGVLVATAESVVVAMPVAVGAFCANDGSRLTAYLSLDGRRLDPAIVDGFAIGNANGTWSHTAYAGTTLFSGAVQGRAPCVAAGGGLPGSDTDYYTFGTSTSVTPGTPFLVWDRQTFRFGPSLLDPSTRGFRTGPTGGSPVEVALALHPESRFQYRLSGGTTWLSAVASSSVGAIDAIRVTTGAMNGAADMVRDIPLMNTD